MSEIEATSYTAEYFYRKIEIAKADITSMRAIVDSVNVRSDYQRRDRIYARSDAIRIL